MMELKKRRIAVFTNGWSNEYLKLIIRGIERKAKNDGVDVFIFATYITYEDENKQGKCQLNIFHLPKPEDFDGAIMLTNTFNLPDEQERILALWGKDKVPMISLEVKIPDMAYLGTDNYSGIKELAEHLIKVHGVKKVVYVNGIADNQENLIRRQALIDVLKANNLELYEELQGDYGYYRGEDLAEMWLEEKREMPDAFVCANDYTAMAMCNVFVANGVEVPGDVIVTGFDYNTDGQKTFPMLASVSRGWDVMGEHAYEKLMYLREHPGENVDKVYDSQFEPGESCGCEIKPAAMAKRLSLLRNVYKDSVDYLTMDVNFQEVRIALSKMDRKEDFFDLVSRIFEKGAYPCKDYYLCVEPSFFELSDIKYPERIRGYSDVMDVILEMKNGKARHSYTFEKKDLVPRYKHKKGESNTYLFMPLNHLEYIIGYVVVKNDLKMLYEQSLRRWIINIDSSLMQARQYVFAQQANEKLRKVYLTDFLTGMYNRAGCEEILYRFVEKEKYAGKDTLLVFADINKMKVINDKYGHLNGDFAIKATADALRMAMGEAWLYGRYGGDEFIAVGKLEENINIDDFRLTIQQRMSDFFKSLQVTFPLSASVGYTIIAPEDMGSIDDYIKKADESMYEQKKIAHANMPI